MHMDEQAYLTMVFNMMKDLSKKELDIRQRAALISEYIQKTGKSQRQVAYTIGVPHSTIQDWCRWNEISQEDYEDLKKKGFTHTDIYRSLRWGTLSRGNKALDDTLKNCISKLRFFKIKPPHTRQTKTLIGELLLVIRKIEAQVQ
jgi:predicted XRE-type DNA-binding protein